MYFLLIVTRPYAKDVNPDKYLKPRPKHKALWDQLKRTEELEEAVTAGMPSAPEVQHIPCEGDESSLPPRRSMAAPLPAPGAFSPPSASCSNPVAEVQSPSAPLPAAAATKNKFKNLSKGSTRR
jgi:hypothetical protein